MNHIPVFLASDDNYAPFLATTAYSTLFHTNSFIDFHILDGGISPLSQKLIAQSLSGFSNFSIRYINMRQYSLNRFPKIKHYSVNAFSRYFIPEIAPELSKAIYMDVDVIVTGDIKNIYDIPLDGCPLGAVLEDFADHNPRYLKQHIFPQYQGLNGYFNSGMLLLDIPLLNKGNYINLCIEKTTELSEKLSCADQDIFNIVFENNFKALDYRYNFMPGYFTALKKLKPQAAEAACCDIHMIHYTAGKPWQKENIEMADEFWKVAAKTAFYNLIKFRFKAEKEKKCLTRIFYLFGLIPVYKIIQQNEKKSRHYLFGVIPFLKTVKK